MKLAPLHARFLNDFGSLLTGWKFVAAHRHFRKDEARLRQYVHVAFINHDTDFHAVIDVAIEFIQRRKRVCIVGAELGNIAGVGQRRFAVSSELQAACAATEAFAYFNQIGRPFLTRFSNPAEVIAVLLAQGPEARLLSPIEATRRQSVQALSALANAA